MNPPQSFLARAGAVALSVVKHVPTRGALWAFIGLAVGSACVAASFAVGIMVMGRAAPLLGYLVAIPLAIPPLGFVLFGMHGLHRGAARAILSLDRQFGLVSYLVDRVLDSVTRYAGVGLGDLPLQRLEGALKRAVQGSLGSDAEEGKGVLAYVLRRARRALVPRIETYLLAEYRAEQLADGSGGGVSIAKVRERTQRAISERLSEIVMSPLNKQLAVFLTLYVLLAGGWWFWLFLMMLAAGTVSGHSGH